MIHPDLRTARLAESAPPSETRLSIPRLVNLLRETSSESAANEVGSLLDARRISSTEGIIMLFLANSGFEPHEYYYAINRIRSACTYDRLKYRDGLLERYRIFRLRAQKPAFRYGRVTLEGGIIWKAYPVEGVPDADGNLLIKTLVPVESGTETMNPGITTTLRISPFERILDPSFYNTQNDPLWEAIQQLPEIEPAPIS